MLIKQREHSKIMSWICYYAPRYHVDVIANTYSKRNVGVINISKRGTMCGGSWSLALVFQAKLNPSIDKYLHAQ